MNGLKIIIWKQIMKSDFFKILLSVYKGIDIVSVSHKDINLKRLCPKVVESVFKVKNISKTENL